MKSILYVLILAFMSITTVMADIDQQSLQFCEKIKSCALQELDGQELSADMEKMIMSSMDGMCNAMAEEFNSENAQGYEDLRQETQVCMDSLSSLSCSALMNGETDTPACIALEKSAEKYNQ